MEDILRSKFAKPHMRRALLQTGTAPLIHEVWWDDVFWGVKNGYGHNHLGRILMSLRRQYAEKE